MSRTRSLDSFRLASRCTKVRALGIDSWRTTRCAEVIPGDLIGLLLPACRPSALKSVRLSSYDAEAGGAKGLRHPPVSSILEPAAHLARIKDGAPHLWQCE